MRLGAVFFGSFISLIVFRPDQLCNYYYYCVVLLLNSKVAIFVVLISKTQQSTLLRDRKQFQIQRRWDYVAIIG